MERSMTRRCSGGKLVKVTVRASGGVIEAVRITGDFFAHPEGAIEAMEEGLVGATLDQVRSAVEAGLLAGTITIGFNPEELISMIEECLR